MPHASPLLEEVGTNVSSADPSARASNFSVLGGMFDDYEIEAAGINPNSPNRDTGQLVGFQYGTALSMLDLAPWLPKPSWLEGYDFGPTAGKEHKLLSSHYILSATLQHVNAVPLDEARASLRDLTDRLADTAAQWAENGADPAGVEQILTERKRLAQQLVTAATANR